MSMDDTKVNALIAAARPSDSAGANVWADIGGLFEQKTFENRIDALTSPATYKTKRETALTEIKKASIAAYTTAYKGYIDAGLSPELAKNNATYSAKSEYQNQQRVFNLQFGQGTDQIFQGASARKGTMGTQGTLAQAAPRARARRAPAKKSAATKSKKAKK
jgi:hypothetical protein